MQDVLKAILIELINSHKEIKEMKSEITLLKEYTNPNAPHYILNEKGERCIANSDKDCFEMPIIQEGRNMPAMVEYMRNPTIETASTWLGVQAKIFNRATKMGVALRFAALEGGSEVYPVSGKDMYASANGGTSFRQDEAIRAQMKKHKDSFAMVVFLGETPELENAWGLESLTRIVYPKAELFNLLLVYKDAKTKQKYDEFYNQLKDNELKSIYISSKKTIDPTLFDSYKVEITPTVVALYKDKKTNKMIKNTINKGFPSSNEILHGIKQFMIFNGILEQKDFHADNIWKASNKDKKGQK